MTIEDRQEVVHPCGHYAITTKYSIPHIYIYIFIYINEVKWSYVTATVEPAQVKEANSCVSKKKNNVST